jgi:predicted transcriptional regulator
LVLFFKKELLPSLHSSAKFRNRGRLLMAEDKAKSIFDLPADEELEAQLDAEAEADYQAGNVVSHADMVAWLKSWGTPDELPPPPLARR